MRHKTILTTIRWAWTFANVMLHTCTPAHAASIAGPGVVATIQGDDASFGHAPFQSAARRPYITRGDGALDFCSDNAR
jgi:hypothetical protein